MRIWSIILIFSITAVGLSCGASRPATPLETFKTYVKAIKAKDTTTMKLLLSKGTIKMHEQEAKSQGVTVDEIVKRETLFSETQKTVEFKDEKIDGDKATLQVKNSYGSWETVPFVREDGDWKIDKQGYAEQMIKGIDDRQDQVFDGLRSFDPQTTPSVTPESTPQ
jgi:hypothetical protein